MTAQYVEIARLSAVIDRRYSEKIDFCKGLPFKGGEPPAKREPDRAKPREKAAGGQSLTLPGKVLRWLGCRTERSCPEARYITWSQQRKLLCHTTAVRGLYGYSDRLCS